MKLETKIRNPFYKWDNGKLYCLDALEFLEMIPENSADLVFLDPPFNLGKSYGSRSNIDDKLEVDDYQEFLFEVLTHSSRILKDGGALFFYHIPEWAIIFANHLNRNLNFRHWISVSMKNGFVRGDFLYPAHYGLLYYTKGEPANFNRPKIQADKCRHCNNYIKDYGGYKKYIEEGINLSDIWTDFSPVRHKNKKNRVANELPIGMLDRVLSIAGVKNGLLVDPFVGSGTSAVSAINFGMNFNVNDREIVCCERITTRINAHKK